KPMRPSELRFPLIVKPLLEDASVGIAQASVVENDEDRSERVKFVHEKFGQAAIVEELIEGRELYVGLVGNATVQLLPIIEMTFGEADNTEHRIATYKAKWDEEYRKRKKIKNVFAKGLSDELTTKIGDICTTAFHALWLQDYGRVDLRLTHDEADGRRVLLLRLGGVGQLLVLPLVRARHHRSGLEPGAPQGAEGVQLPSAVPLGLRRRRDVSHALLPVVRPSAEMALLGISERLPALQQRRERLDGRLSLVRGRRHGT